MGTGRPAAARACSADGSTGFLTTSWVQDQDAGRARKVATLHLR
jgi:hypothetical protein